MLGGQNGKFRRYQCINVMEIRVYHAKIKLFLIPLINRSLAVPDNQLQLQPTSFAHHFTVNTTMDILMSETCWAHNKWNKIASDIKLVFHSSTLAMMHGPIYIRNYEVTAVYILTIRSFEQNGWSPDTQSPPQKNYHVKSRNDIVVNNIVKDPLNPLPFN